MVVKYIACVITHKDGKVEVKMYSPGGEHRKGYGTLERSVFVKTYGRGLELAEKMGIR